MARDEQTRLSTLSCLLEGAAERDTQRSSFNKQDHHWDSETLFTETFSCSQKTVPATGLDTLVDHRPVRLGDLPMNFFEAPMELSIQIFTGSLLASVNSILCLVEWKKLDWSQKLLPLKAVVLPNDHSYFYKLFWGRFISKRVSPRRDCQEPIRYPSPNRRFMEQSISLAPWTRLLNIRIHRAKFGANGQRLGEGHSSSSFFALPTICTSDTDEIVSICNVTPTVGRGREREGEGERKNQD